LSRVSKVILKVSRKLAGFSFLCIDSAGLDLSRKLLSATRMSRKLRLMVLSTAIHLVAADDEANYRWAICDSSVLAIPMEEDLTGAEKDWS